MTDLNEQIILVTKPSIKTIGFGLVGTIFFAAFVYLILSMKWTVVNGTDKKTGIVIIWVILGSFIFFSLASLWTIVNIKTIVLTSKTLIIKKPFLFLSKSIPIDNIQLINEIPFKINSTIRWKTYSVYDGKQMLLKFYNGKSIKLNSFEIPEYYFLTQSLYKLKRNSDTKSNDIEEYLQNKNQGYGWLIFIVFLTGGLIYSIIKHRL